jgi:hypothetical protein
VPLHYAAVQPYKIALGLNVLQAENKFVINKFRNLILRVKTRI